MMNNKSTQRPTQTIAILQYNLNTNQAVTHSVLNSPTSKKYAILLLQEQHIPTNTKSSLTHQSWTLIEAKSMDNKPPRAVIYLNKTILPAHSYEIISLDIPDIIIIAIRHDQEQHPTLIVNVYNTKGTSQLTKATDTITETSTKSYI
jgi:hypothetical protein